MSGWPLVPLAEDGVVDRQSVLDFVEAVGLVIAEDKRQQVLTALAGANLEPAAIASMIAGLPQLNGFDHVDSVLSVVDAMRRNDDRRISDLGHELFDAIDGALRDAI